MAKAFAALIVCIFIAFPAGAAQLQPDNKKPVQKPVRPVWSELTPPQQQILAPLQSDWDQLDALRRKKWVEIAGRYPKMKPEEQQRLQQRMTEWTRLTPAERKAARDRYQSLQKLPPQKRQEVSSEWERYQKSLAQQQRKQGAPLDPSLTDPAEAQAPAAAAPDSTASK